MAVAGVGGLGSYQLSDPSLAATPDWLKNRDPSLNRVDWGGNYDPVTGTLGVLPFFVGGSEAQDASYYQGGDTSDISKYTGVLETGLPKYNISTEFGRPVDNYLQLNPESINPVRIINASKGEITYEGAGDPAGLITALDKSTADGNKDIWSAQEKVGDQWVTTHKNEPYVNIVTSYVYPAFAAIAGATVLGPIIGGTAGTPLGAGQTALAAGKGIGTAIGSTAGNFLTGTPLDESLVRGLTAGATVFGGAGLGPIIGGGSFGVGAGAAAANFAANIAQGKSVEDALTSAGITAVTAGAMDTLLGGGGNTGKPSPGEIRAAEALGVNSAPGYSLNTAGQLIDPSGNVISLAAAKAALASGVPIAGGGGATATGGGPLITVTGSGIGTLGSTIAGGTANLNLPNFENVDLSEYRYRQEGDPEGTFRDQNGVLRENVTNEIVVTSTGANSSNLGGIGSLNINGGGGTLESELLSEADRNRNGGGGNGGIGGGGTLESELLSEADRNRGGGGTLESELLSEADRNRGGGGGGNDLVVTGRRTFTLLPGESLAEVRNSRIRNRINADPITGSVNVSDILDLGLPEPELVSTGRRTNLTFLPTQTGGTSLAEDLGVDPEGPSTKSKILSTLKTIVGLSPLLGLIPAGDGGGGTLDPGPGLTRGGIGGGRIRNPATFDPFTYGQREGEFDFFRNAPATTGTVTGIGGTGTTGTTTTGTTGTTTTGTTTAGTPGPAATAAEVSAAYPGYTNIRQAADGRWFGEPIPGYTASGPAPTGLRVTAGSTFNPTVEDYRLFNPNFESVERGADGQFMGVNFQIIPGAAGMSLEQVKARFPNYRDIRQDASGRFIGTRDVPGQVIAAPTTLEQVRALNLGYDDYGQNEGGGFYGVTNETTSRPRPFTLADAQARFGQTYSNITQNPQGQFVGARTVQTSAAPTLEQIRNLGLGYDDYEQDGTDFYGIRNTTTSVPGTRLTLEQVRAANPDYEDYGTNEAGEYFGIRTVNDGPPMAEGGEVDDDMVRHLIEYRKGGGHMGPGQVKGIGSGQEDKIPAWLSDGEYVWSAQDVADLGDGSTDEGVRRLDRMRKMVRQQAGRKDVKKIAKPQRGIEDMLKAVGGAV